MTTHNNERYDHPKEVFKTAYRVRRQYCMPVEEIAEEITKFNAYYIRENMNEQSSNITKYRRGWLMRADCEYIKEVTK